MLLKYFPLIGASIIICAVACGSGGGGGGEENPVTSNVRGHIVEVVARNITEIETLRIRDAAGQELTFTTERFAGFTPTHLKEHQLFGQSVLVFYIEKDGVLVAVDITD